MIVPVSAVQYDGDTAFVYLAAEDTKAGTMLSESEMDLDKLTKLTVTTGMSDGSYIVVTADGLAAGDVIWSPERTSTATYTEDDTTTTSTFGFGGQGGMMGGQSGNFQPPSDMGGGNMGQMPSGGN